MAIKILVIICFIIYIAFAAYLSIYWEKSIRSRFPRCKYVIRPILTLIAALPIISAINFIWHPNMPGVDLLSFSGFLVSAFFLYLAMFMVITHLFTLILTKVFHRGKWWKTSKGRIALIAAEIGFSLFFCIFGVWGANHTNVEEVDLGTGANSLKVVALSDIHYGTPGNTVDLEKMANLINQQKPDLVLIAGDIFDNDTKVLDNNDFASAMRKIDSTYGIYAVTGNHEYYENNQAEIKEYYQNTGVTLLIDEAVEIEGLLRIAGRDDIGYLTESQNQRKPLEDILEGTNASLPLIVMDHQPQNFREAQNTPAFLEIAGHTHNGQIWPGNILVGLIYKIAYNCPTDGIHNYDDFTLAITKGYGTWGFPMRSTGTSHIYSFNIKASVLEGTS